MVGPLEIIKSASNKKLTVLPLDSGQGLHNLVQLCVRSSQQITEKSRRLRLNCRIAHKCHVAYAFCARKLRLTSSVARTHD